MKFISKISSIELGVEDVVYQCVSCDKNYPCVLITDTNAEFPTACPYGSGKVKWIKEDTIYSQ